MRDRVRSLVFIPRGEKSAALMQHLKLELIPRKEMRLVTSERTIMKTHEEALALGQAIDAVLAACEQPTTTAVTSEVAA